jgi:hypothetical protein
MILTNIEYKIRLDDNLIVIDKLDGNTYISISLPLYWTQHVDDCDDCKSFYSKLKNESKDDWFVNYNDEYYKLEFLDNQYIGNGHNTIMDSKIDLKKVDISNINHTEYYKIQNIKLISVNKYESIEINRNDKLDHLIPSEYNDTDKVIYKNMFFTPISKEFSEDITNNEQTIKIELDKLESFDFKILISKK